MKILLLCKNGKVGWELQRSLATLGEVKALDRQGAEGLCVDHADQERHTATDRTLATDVIVNSAAYTTVDKAETE
ncbi:sugar nucleotide-binding protein, partial [Pseudomonas syringae pv. tagetis]|uniref:sugar nucleotide-binding protein n=1 Tax=Pseudomonas syringae group genomosp. 7 TaxID=251699 RepID=UPI00376FCCBB